MKNIKLSPRLAAVASFVDKCRAVADIGTDHGYIPVYLVQNNICETAVASDIGKGPLSSAVRTAQEYGVSHKLSFVCAPGLDGVSEGSVETVIIAGMGGETIAGIMSDATWLKSNKTHLIIQPQSKIDRLEVYLGDNGYCVDKAKLVKDAGRIYLVLSVRYYGIHSEFTRFFTGYLQEDPLFEEYVTGLLKKLSQIKQGILSAEVVNDPLLRDVEEDEQYLKSLIGEKE